MGDEFYRKGANIQLGPGMCIARNPRNGRNFEYAAGEDPFLGYTMVGPIVAGIQSQGVIANAKHFVNNNQETNRSSFTANVDERTQFEMYYPPFEGAVDAGVGSIMCSYNKECIDCPTSKIGKWSCENPDSLQRDLKGRIGFKGWIMSDWGGTHSASINSGLDQEMPGPGHMSTSNLMRMVQSGEVPMSKVNDSAIRIMWPFFKVGLFDKANNNTNNTNVTTQEHTILARKLSAEATVLLKNNGILPLQKSIKKIAVIGGQASSPIVHGGGSGWVGPSYVATPLNSMRNRFKIPYADKDCNSDGYCIHYNNGSDTKAAGTLAAQSDAAIIFVGISSSEGFDRPNLGLGDQDKLIQEVAKAAGKKTVVVAVTTGAFLTPWRDDVAAVLTPFMPGQEYGNAITDVLFGVVNPGGKLPITFPTKENEMEMTSHQYPGVNDISVYSEKLEVGYRWYDAHKVNPAFPFGHGLSYTKFDFSGLKISGRTVTCNVKNSGKMDGNEAVQLYLEFPSSAGEPPKQSRAFKNCD